MKDSSKKSNTDLMKELEIKQVTLRNIRFGQSGSKSKNVKEVKNIKKDIARIKTELTRMSNGQGIKN